MSTAHFCLPFCKGCGLDLQEPMKAVERKQRCTSDKINTLQREIDKGNVMAFLLWTRMAFASHSPLLSVSFGSEGEQGRTGPQGTTQWKLFLHKPHLMLFYIFLPKKRTVQETFLNRFYSTLINNSEAKGKGRGGFPTSSTQPTLGQPDGCEWLQSKV